MKKQILNIGTVLSKAEQKNVYGGNSIIHQDPNCLIWRNCCGEDSDCVRYINNGMTIDLGTCQSGACVY